MVRVPCDPISTALACLACSAILTSDWFMACLSYWCDLLHSNALVIPMPWRPTAAIPTTSLCLSELSSWLTLPFTHHFLPVRVTITASRVSSSGESLSVSNNLVLAVLIPPSVSSIKPRLDGKFRFWSPYLSFGGVDQ